ncbi:DUF2721 domain-containing protein [Arenimonas oryziterrae]|uniref:DUF2721 domain-containing protein n=1 Tax=Arenimonas oryziterrae DSM 21050 = YC6267 TaxID=1121015 RepID=A0A091AW88_9GAMM|nr:DUF2721 domain-containing protein [Arenimonas oryziterrae]KFN42924.1 hypothetical protein N789_12425 [Arenimonas oryziterrae DSM 21050 = YC6267]
MPSPLNLSSEHYAVVSAMITPAFFLTATSSLLASSNGRLARVVDRMRVQIAQLQHTEEGGERLRLEAKIASHRKRSKLVLHALQMLYGAMSAFVGTSLAIALDQFTGYRLGALPTGLAVLGVLLVLAASINLGREARISVAMLDEELIRELDRDHLPRPVD